MDDLLKICGDLCAIQRQARELELNDVVCALDEPLYFIGVALGKSCQESD